MTVWDFWKWGLSILGMSFAAALSLYGLIGIGYAAWMNFREPHPKKVIDHNTTVNIKSTDIPKIDRYKATRKMLGYNAN